MDEEQARTAFALALGEYQPGFNSFFLARLLGLSITYPEDVCVVDMKAADWMFNPQGSLHGGLITTVLDISMGHLLHHTSGAGSTLEMKTQFLRSAGAGRLRSTASFLRRGRSICFLQSRMSDAEDKPIAVASATWRLLGS